jgi:Ribonucleotide reductase, small chain/SCP-2 sterol transfer family
MAVTDAPLAADKVSYEDLYQRWEKGNWSATEIDLSEDRRQWEEELTPFQRKAALWNYALFFWGEDAVADNLSPYIDAAPREEQKYFLATQQVDEARHAVLFGRFMAEVVGIGGSQGERLEAIRPQLTWGFRKVFDRLDTMADELRKDRSKPKLAAAVTLYHVIVEASLAQPGQHFIEGYLEERDLMPGFRQGMRNVAADEQRHIAFGVKLLADLQREEPKCREAVAGLLREVIPWTAAVLTPPGMDRAYTETFGFTLEEIGAYGAESLMSKLRAAGLAVETLPGPQIIPADLPPTVHAERGLALMQAGILGEKTGPARRDPEILALLFDMTARSVNPDHGLGSPATIQWDFSDAPPYRVRIDNGSTAALPGLDPDADLTLRLRYDDWVDVIGGRVDPRRLLVTGRLRPRGSVRLLLRMPRIFG